MRIYPHTGPINLASSYFAYLHCYTFSALCSLDYLSAAAAGSRPVNPNRDNDTNTLAGVSLLLYCILLSRSIALEKLGNENYYINDRRASAGEKSERVLMSRVYVARGSIIHDAAYLSRSKRACVLSFFPPIGARGGLTTRLRRLSNYVESLRPF